MSSPQNPNDPNAGFTPAPPPSEYGQQPQYGQQYGYGPLPDAPSMNEQGPRQAVPKEVTASFWLWIAGAVISVLSAVLALAFRQDLVDQIRATTPQASRFTDAQLENFVNATLGVGIAIALIFAGLFVLFAFKAWAGRNWARITLTVLTVLNVFLTLLGVAGGGAGTGSIASYVTLLIAVVATVLLFLPSSNAYYNAMKRAG